MMKDFLRGSGAIEGETKRQAWVRGLREIADFISMHEDCPIPTSSRFDIFGISKDELAKFAVLFGNAEKQSLGELFVLVRRFGPHTLEANWNHEEVCERVVVGTEEVDEPIMVQQGTKKVTREKIEWKCPESIIGRVE